MTRHLYLCGDIGGTNARFSLFASSRTDGFDYSKLSGADVDLGKGGNEVSLGEQVFMCKNHSSLAEIITLFLSKYNTSKEPLYCMCLAVAGPVNNNTAKITNLPWLIDGAALADSFKAHKVVLLNDFVGIGYGLLALSSKDLQVVHPGCGKVNPTGVKAVIGAGTGLGECFLTHNGRDYDVWPAEGGHADFAPRNRTEFEILEHILHAENAKPNQTHPVDRVSVERVTSGSGLPNIYHCLARKHPDQVNPDIAKLIADKGILAGSVIAENAQTGKCLVCVKTMDVFCSTYGAEAGNLCLKTLPTGGLYIAGGIAMKVMDIMKKNNQFVSAYLAKGRMSQVLNQFPIYLITHPNVGLLGSQVTCRRILHQADSTQLIRSKL